MKVAHRRTHAVLWALLAPGLLVFALWAAWSRPAVSADTDAVAAPAPTVGDEPVTPDEEGS